MQIVTDQLQKELKEHGNYSFPILVSQEKLSAYESGSFLWHWHPEIELTLVTRGQMIYQVNSNLYHLHQGEALFGNSGTLHTGRSLKNRDCSYTSITFEPKLIYGYENSIIYTSYVKPVIQNFSLSAVHFDLSQDWHRRVLALINEIIEIDSKHSTTYEIDITVRLQQFWQLLFLHSSLISEDMGADRRSYERICSILSYIEEHYAEKLTLEDIAETVHLCKSECSRIFRKYMNISLFEFILRYRIEKSIHYLTNTKYSVTETAAMVGFQDSNYFSKVFRAQKGCSPTKFKQKTLSGVFDSRGDRRPDP